MKRKKKTILLKYDIMKTIQKNIYKPVYALPLCQYENIPWYVQFYTLP